MSNDYFSDSLGLSDFTRARVSPLNALSAQIETSFDKLPTLSDFNTLMKPYVTAGGTANAITAAHASNPLATYATGQQVRFRASATNTGPATLDVDEVGVAAIRRADGTALSAGDITSGRMYTVVYDGSNWVIEGTIVTVNQAGLDLLLADATVAVNAAEAAAAAAEAAKDAAEAVVITYTAADVLSKLITVDGDGSGLDADLVRGATPGATGLSILSAASAPAVRTVLSLGNVNNTSDANKPVSTATQAALNVKAPIASPTFTGTVTLPGDPVSDNEAATKRWTETLVSTLTNEQPLGPVDLVATGNITLSGEQTIDGVLTSSSDVLVTGKASAAQNGIYTTGAGAWTRRADADSWAEILNATVLVSSGSTYTGSRWRCTIADGGTIGVNAIAFVQTYASAAYTASGGVTKSGFNFTLSSMPANTIRGNNTGGSAAPANLTGSQVTAMLDTFGAAKGLVPGVTATGAKYLGDGGWSNALTPGSLAASGTISGSNLSGTNTGDQTITLTGDVTGSGTGSFATTIANNTVSLAKLADVAAGTVFYRKTAGTGDPEVQTLATLKSDLGLSGTNTGDQTSVTGNAGTATALQAARSFSITGGATAAGVSFDGTGNVALNVTALNMAAASAGTLAVARGGTGTTTSTGTGSLVLSSGPTFSGTANFASITISGSFSMGAGTAASPSYTFSGDSDTGIYRPGADEIGIATGGSLRLSASSSAIEAMVPIRIPDGSVSVPGIAFASDSNTGIYRVGDDALGIVAGGLQILTASESAVGVNKPLEARDGSAAVPSYSFDNDADTGLYRSGAGQIGIAADGEQIATIKRGSLRIVHNDPPGNPSWPGEPGEIRWSYSDGGTLFLCVTANTWRRVNLSTW